MDLLFTPYVKAAYQLVRTHHGLPALPTPTSSPRRGSPTGHPDMINSLVPMTTIGHLALFNQHLQKSDRQVEWIYSEGDGAGASAKTTTPVWCVKVIVNGEFFGDGRGNTKKAARNEAAKVGLEKMGIIVW